MIINYLKIAWRTLIRNKRFSLINIFGLTLGITCSILILLWVQDERRVDAFHKNGPDLYQVYERNYYDGKVDAGYATQGLLADELKRVIPEVRYAAAMDFAAPPGTKNTLEAGNKIIKMYGFFAGADFFRMFSYSLLQGRPEVALQTPNAIAISRRVAEEFFGSPERAIGNTIRFDNIEALQVTAVFEDLPSYSSRQFDFLRSWTDYVKQNDWVKNWGNQSVSSYIQLQPGTNPAKVEQQIKDFVYRYMPKRQSSRLELALQSYPEKYLHSNIKSGKPDGGRIEYVRLFTGIAAFILLIACINFMNLATAQSAKRAKEVGLRKVIGALRSSLISQFIGEALLLAFFSIAIALALTSILLPFFNQLTGKQLTLPLTQSSFWMAVVGLLLLTGFVAGSYPALFLSSLKPIKVLKGQLKFGGAVFRKGLVVFQFTLSMILIVGMIVIYRQVSYIQTTNIGYDRGNLVYIPIEGELATKYSLFKEEAIRTPGIVDVSKMRNSPTIIEHHTGSISWPGKDPNLQAPFADGVVGYDFVKTMKLQLKEGRDFSRDYGGDSTGFLINETAAKQIGWQEPLGQTMTWGGRRGQVIGVIKDFHFASMHQAIEPLIVRLDENWNWGTILVRTRAGRTREAIAGLERLYKELNPKFPFTYQFSDEEFSHLYRAETVVSQLAGCFATLAILISCLGLFGLAAFTAAQRTREIGVRKVLGATVPRITAMLSGDFLKLVALAILVAFPLAWLIMDHWLGQFAYKTNMEWWIFVLAGLATLLVALATVSYQSIRAALANPVKSLRTE